MPKAPVEQLPDNEAVLNSMKPVVKDAGNLRQLELIRKIKSEGIDVIDAFTEEETAVVFAHLLSSLNQEKLLEVHAKLLEFEQEDLNSNNGEEGKTMSKVAVRNTPETIDIPTGAREHYRDITHFLYGNRLEGFEFSATGRSNIKKSNELRKELERIEDIIESEEREALYHQGVTDGMLFLQAILLQRAGQTAAAEVILRDLGAVVQFKVPTTSEPTAEVKHLLGIIQEGQEEWYEQQSLKRKEKAEKELLDTIIIRGILARGASEVPAVVS